MAAKVPIRTVFDGDGNATGLADFQSGEFVGLAYGGLGASLSIGSAGQVLKVNSGATALEFGTVEAVFNIDGMSDGSGTTIVDSDKFAMSDGGTEKYVLASDISNYIQTDATTFSNVTTVGALASGSIASGFGTISTGNSITTTSTVTGATITDGTASLASGSLTSAVNITGSGTVTGGTLTDGTASLSSGSLSSAVNGTFSGTVDAGTLTENSVAVATKPFAIAQAIALG